MINNKQLNKQKTGLVIPITKAKKLISVGDDIEWIPIYITTESRRNIVVAIYSEDKSKQFRQINLYSKSKYVLLLDNNTWIISDLVVGKLPDTDTPKIPSMYLNKSVDQILETYNAYKPVVISETEINKHNNIENNKNTNNNNNINEKTYKNSKQDTLLPQEHKMLVQEFKQEIKKEISERYNFFKLFFNEAKKHKKNKKNKKK